MTCAGGGPSIWWGCLHEGMPPGDLHPGNLPQEGDGWLGGWTDPPESEKWVVRILLECFLVSVRFNFRGNHDELYFAELFRGLLLSYDW